MHNIDHESAKFMNSILKKILHPNRKPDMILGNLQPKVIQTEPIHFTRSLISIA